MEKTTNVHVPDNRWPLAAREGDHAWFLRESMRKDYHGKEGELLPAQKDLSPDHLTATYWG